MVPPAEIKGSDGPDYSAELPPELRPPVVVERPEGSGVFVRLNDSYLRSIAYIGRERSDGGEGIEYEGTAFLLSHDGFTYLVTAAHVATNFRHGNMDVRLNRVDDGLEGIEHFEDTNWVFHEDSTVDVAVMPFSIPTWAKAGALDSGTIATDFKVGTKDFGPGDLAYVVGIFKKLRGKKKNEPFVHTGHVASMGREEEVDVDDWRPEAQAKMKANPQLDLTLKIRGYFIQATTLPESSGSPVFIRRSLEIAHVKMKENDDPAAREWVYGSIWLLGLWSAAWRTHDEAADVILGDDMGLCTPAPRILEVLNCDKLKTMRKEAKDKEKKGAKLELQSKAKLPAKQSKTAEDENPNHQQDFDALLTKAVTPKKAGG